MNIIPARTFDLFYGQPATGKSEAGARVAEKVVEETGKKVRAVIGDGSLYTYQHLQDAGVGEILEFAQRDWPTDTLQRLCTGWWPADVEDPTSPLLPPNADTLNVGMYAFEGVSVAGAYIMSNIKGGFAWAGGRGEKIGQDSPVRILNGELDPKTGKLLPDSGPGTTFGGNPIAHYQHAQRILVDLIQSSKRVAPVVIWTGHEAISNPESNDLNKEVVVGPEAAGKALVDKLQRIFVNTLHFQSIGKKVKIDDAFTQKKVDDLDLEYRVYSRDHFHAAGMVSYRYKACTRGVNGEFPQYFTHDDPGKAVLEFYTELAKVKHNKATHVSSIKESV